MTATTRTRATRRIGADPTSTALLLAAPAALELWPGVRRVGSAGSRALVDAELPGRATAATVRALPPHRTPTAFVTRFSWSGPGLPTSQGLLRLVPSGPHETSAELLLDSEGVDESGVDPAVLDEMARGFLANLASRAEERNQAA